MKPGWMSIFNSLAMAVFALGLCLGLCGCRSLGGFAVPVHLPSNLPSPSPSQSPSSPGKLFDRPFEAKEQDPIQSLKEGNELEYIDLSERARSIRFEEDLFALEACQHLDIRDFQFDDGYPRLGYSQRETLQLWGAKINADTIWYSSTKLANDKVSVSSHFFSCAKVATKFETIETFQIDWTKRKSSGELNVSLGSYMARHGILNNLGGRGFTLGLGFAVYPEELRGRPNSFRSHFGYFFHWTFDHYSDTDDSLLKPDFKGLNYTNYLAAGGLAFRYYLGKRFAFKYKGGLAINFIEIDTFRSNGDTNDSKYRDITISTVHKIGFDVLMTGLGQKQDQLDIYRRSLFRLGFSVLYYFTPDPLGEFANDSIEDEFTPGGSSALLLDLTWEFL